MKKDGHFSPKNFFSESTFGIYIQVLQERNSTQVYCLAEVLQGRSKSKFNIIISINLPLVFIFKCHFYPISELTRRGTRHHLGEVIQG